MSDACLCGATAFAPLLTGTDRLYRLTEERFQVVACRECGMLRLYPRPSEEALRNYYPNAYWFAPDPTAAGRLEERYRRVVLRDHLRFVEQALRGRDPVLDVGCGGGLFLGMLRRRGYRVLGLDVSEEAARVAWKWQRVPAACGSLERSPIGAGSCAAVTLFHVVEHLSDPRTHLRSARELLPPDGRLIVQLPNAACWQFRCLGAAWTGIDVPRHLFHYRDRDLEALLTECGFAVVRRKYFSLRDNPAGLASSLAPGLDPMARRVRGVAESPAGRLARDLAYFALVAAALPFTVVEAAWRAGSTVMLEARRA